MVLDRILAPFCSFDQNFYVCLTIYIFRDCVGTHVCTNWFLLLFLFLLVTFYWQLRCCGELQTQKNSDTFHARLWDSTYWRPRPSPSSPKPTPEIPRSQIKKGKGELGLWAVTKILWATKTSPHHPIIFRGSWREYIVQVEAQSTPECREEGKVFQNSYSGLVHVDYESGLSESLHILKGKIKSNPDEFTRLSPSTSRMVFFNLLVPSHTVGHPHVQNPLP